MQKNLYKNKTQSKALFDSPFILPMNSKITSPFGEIRIFNHTKRSAHTGTDFKALTPQKVKAINDGKVLFSGKLFYCGNAIIIDHGLGITSQYCHLSKRYVTKDKYVKKGQVIGLTGKTGQISGPHLHVTLKYKNQLVDLVDFVEKSKVLK